MMLVGFGCCYLERIIEVKIYIYSFGWVVMLAF